MIEFALVLPVFLLLVVGIFYLGIVYFTGQSVQLAAQRGADAAITVDPERSKADFSQAALSQVRDRLRHAVDFFPGAIASPELAAMTNHRCGGQARGSYVCIADDASGDGYDVEVRLLPAFGDLWPGFPDLIGFVTDGKAGSSLIQGVGVSHVER